MRILVTIFVGLNVEVIAKLLMPGRAEPQKHNNNIRWSNKKGSKL